MNSAEEVHAKLYQEALENLDDAEEVFYYLCPVYGTLKNCGLKNAVSAGIREKNL